MIRAFEFYHDDTNLFMGLSYHDPETIHASQKHIVEKFGKPSFNGPITSWYIVYTDDNGVEWGIEVHDWKNNCLHKYEQKIDWHISRRHNCPTSAVSELIELLTERY